MKTGTHQTSPAAELPISLTSRQIAASEILPLLGFSTSDDNLWSKKYAAHSAYEISVDIKNERVHYGPSITLGDTTTANLSHSENIVVLECVNRLLEKGYKPKDLTLEKKWALGRTSKGGKADVTVNGQDGKVIFIVECKNWGSEYEKEKSRMQSNGGQLFSYLQQDRNTKYLCLYTSTVQGSIVRYENAIVRAFDDPKLIELAGKSDEEIPLLSVASTVPELHAAWRDSYSAYFHPNGIFDDDAQAYNIELKPLKAKDLKGLSEGDGGFIHNQFAEILRHNNISDRENAFNRMISLFLCKVVDENKGENEVVDFQWKEGADEYEDLQDRLQRLYQVGMRDYLREEVIYFENDYVEKAFRFHKKAIAKDRMISMLKALKFYTNNEFAFREVHNERLFQQNAKVLNEVVQLLQPYKVKYSEKHQFLGNLFELLLNDGIKQSEGQFFTPTPIAAFIVACLPLHEEIERRITRGEVHKLLRMVDYACGSGHFLTEAIDAIQLAGKTLDVPEAVDTRWTRDYIFGIERDYRLARVAKIACFMNGAGDANIIYGDGLDNHSELGKPGSFDLLIANPPYSIKDFKQHIRLKHNSFTILDDLTDTSSEIETLFVERIGQLLKPGGFAGVILPSSILSNTGVYTRARKLVLQHFDIRGIVELGGSTFIATGTNTVILFLRKRINGDFTHYSYRADSVFDDGKLSDSDFKDDGLLREYTDAVGIAFDDYVTLISRKPNENLVATELYESYQIAFVATSKKYQLSRAFLQKTATEQKADLSELFISFVSAREKMKFLYFCLVRGKRITVAKAGSDKNVEKAFLGYEWSKRRGFEGMRVVSPGGKLYDPSDPRNPKKVASYVRKSFLDGEIPDVDEDIKDHVSIIDLATTLDFSEAECDLRISTDPSVSLPVTTKYPSIRFDKIARLEYGKGLAATKRVAGPYPVMGSNGPDGTHNVYLIEGPAIVVGRKGSAGKIALSWESCWPIDTTFWVKFDQNRLKPLFLYWTLRWLDLTRLVGRKSIGVPGLNRNDVHKQMFPDVPTPVQNKIVKELKAVKDNLKDADAHRLAVIEKWLM